jgi:hypothetical protein
MLNWYIPLWWGIWTELIVGVKKLRLLKGYSVRMGFVLLFIFIALNVFEFIGDEGNGSIEWSGSSGVPQLLVFNAGGQDSDGSWQPWPYRSLYASVAKNKIFTNKLISENLDAWYEWSVDNKVGVNKRSIECPKE